MVRTFGTRPKFARANRFDATGGLAPQSSYMLGVLEPASHCEPANTRQQPKISDRHVTKIVESTGYFRYIFIFQRKSKIQRIRFHFYQGLFVKFHSPWLVTNGVRVSPSIASVLGLAALAFTALLAKADDTPAKGPASEVQERLFADIKYLSSDELQGRAAETPGLKMAAKFIANRWQELGLKTDLFDGKPFQEFQLPGTSVFADPESNRLAITKPTGQKVELALTKQFNPQSLGKSGGFDGGLVFVGYGITATEEDLKYDDFAGIDVKGKVVIVIRKEPQANDPTSPFNGDSPSQYALFTAKQKNAALHGVAAMIMVNDQNTDKTAPDTVLPISGSGTAASKDQVPTLYVKRSEVESWLKDSGKSLSEIESEIDLDLKPRSFEMAGWKAEGNVELKKLQSMNVLGVLPGQGALANEYIVLGAHFDHVGMGGMASLAPGTIDVHNGADDNASGTVCLLEAARQLSLAAKKDASETPRRTLVFIAFSGEELGLLGSEYYVKHPRFELENTVAMINMDMVGRLTDNNLTVYGTGTAKELDAIVTKANDSLAFALTKLPEGMGPSDHQSFFQKNIPVLHFFTGLHNDYHRPSDDFDKINLSGIERITDMVTGIANGLVTQPEKLTFVKVKGRANPQANVPRRTRLGARLKLNVPGVVVDRLLTSGLAVKAGIQPDDKILKINEDETTSRAELDRVLQKVKQGDTLKILVERGAEKIELKVELTD